MYPRSLTDDSIKPQIKVGKHILDRVELMLVSAGAPAEMFAGYGIFVLNLPESTDKPCERGKRRRCLKRYLLLQGSGTSYIINV